MIQPLFPPAAPNAATALLEALADPQDGPALHVGDERMLDFLDAVGHRLRTPAYARRHPELGPLGAYLRRSHLRAELARLDAESRSMRFVRRPLGLVFHVAPGNADTVFVYSWALAALAGNRNVVRLSERGGEVTQAVLFALVESLDQADPVIAATQRIVSYSHHDEAATAAFSAACDLRVLWGGDQAIREIRRAPLRPSARELTFPNRSSFATISASAFLAAGPLERRRAVEAFHSDAYLFGQAACASPGAIFWIGAASAVEDAQAVFTTLLRQIVDARGPRIDAAMAIQKHAATYGLAAEGVADAVRFIGNEISTVQLTTPVRLPRRWLGTGTFAQLRVDSLDELTPLLLRQDQTLTYFGFSADDMLSFAQRLGGRGLDRIVPMGRALEFSTIWDGYDLLREFTRLVTIS
ncbi:acyl-CoA reductase [Paraburkholderia fungorum]|uniref:Gamma-glutamyl phosphate reductase n=1 Tax=Paraburkholderia fungorum TaxID=134537 RepID=A0A3R7HRU2_9BURK|nr:acyl-CoA reductase [Paraburkholderia fungorum]RKF49719.1 gamma-glutamyl phosphate reductase [Paraburkholderia fungorum]